jgi:hypothetical protein
VRYADRALGCTFNRTIHTWTYNTDTRHYNVTTNIKAAMAEGYMCNACDTL